MIQVSLNTSAECVISVIDEEHRFVSVEDTIKDTCFTSKDLKQTQTFSVFYNRAKQLVESMKPRRKTCYDS